MRVRSMQMNDAHIYCSENNSSRSSWAWWRCITNTLNYSASRIRYAPVPARKSRLGKKYVDNERLWLKTEEMVRNAMRNGNVPYVEAEDEAAFYGPKVDVQIGASLARNFISTNQVDFAVPARFDLKFTNKEGVEEVPLCIHRAPLSTHERMIGFFDRALCGQLPVWLSPEHVRVIPITDGQNDYANQIVQQLRDQSIRASADISANA